MIQGAAVLREGLTLPARPRVAVYPGFVSLMNLRGKRFLRRDTPRPPFAQQNNRQLCRISGLNRFEGDDACGSALWCMPG